MVELAPRILSAALDETSSVMLSQILTSNGADSGQQHHHLNHEVDGRRAGACYATAASSSTTAHLWHRRTTQIELARAAGITVNKGIVADRYRHPSPDICRRCGRSTTRSRCERTVAVA